MSEPQPVATTTQKPLWKILLTEVHWLNLLNPRMWISAGFTGFLAAIPASMIWEPLILPVFFTVFAAALLAMSLNPPACPQCRKRVKIGATHCRACGVNVQDAAQR